MQNVQSVDYPDNGEFTLITFQSPPSGSFTMLRGHAEPLLRMMDHSGGTPGALASEDVPGALEKLTKALQVDETLPADVSEPADAGTDDDLPTSLGTRAYPLLEMLKAAAREKAYIAWYPAGKKP